ncbi:hypothetical protein EIP91_002080 [Steccherinum ochraceum]|uniref:Uncharacterized protein n=1 Tax=Steccherinum ochraceum TaxID=92696 RepID=A0A4R0S2N3_9APHY|nr:hypothetical protein EIP91_002080 [Steccherinum ochraceum]
MLVEFALGFGLELHDEVVWPRLPTGLGPVPRLPLPPPPELVPGLDNEKGGVCEPAVAVGPTRLGLEKVLAALGSRVAVPGRDPVAKADENIGDAASIPPPVPGRERLVLLNALGPANAKDGEPSELSWVKVDGLRGFVGLIGGGAARLGDVEVTLVLGLANAAAMVLDSDELPGRESASGAAVVNDVRLEDGVGVGSCRVKLCEHAGHKIAERCDSEKKNRCSE